MMARITLKRAKELQDKWGGQLVVDAGSSAGSLIPDLEAAGVNLHLMSTRDVARACGLFRDSVTDSLLHHLDQASLNEAVNGAALRDLGDQQAWNRRSATSNISPLMRCMACSRRLLPRVSLRFISSKDPDDSCS
jgi:hypothetical protein